MLRVRVPASGPELSLDQVLCFKHRRKVAKDNTVKFQLHTLQLLPEPEHPSYAGAAVEVLEGLDGQLRVRHEGRIINTQEAPPSPVFLRNGHGGSAATLVSPAGANYSDRRWAATLKALDSGPANEEHEVDISAGASARPTPATVSPRKPTFLQRERWKAIQKALHKGMSLRAIERELESTGPPSRSTWIPTVPQGGGPGQLSPRQALIQWQHEKVTFMPNT